MKLELMEIFTKYVQLPKEYFLQSSQSAVVGVIIFDQLPRNLFRNQLQAFEYDSIALSIATEAVKLDYHQQLSDTHRNTLLLPYLHSENLEILQAGIELYSFNPKYQKIAIDNSKIVQKFGRLPFLNEVFNRPCSIEELNFLQK